MKTSSRKCPCCGGRDLREGVFVRRCTPALNNRLHPDRDSALAAPAGPLELAQCRSCGHAFNAAFDPALADYGEGYNSGRSVSPAYRAHLEATARFLVSHAGTLSGGPLRVLELGCGDGVFLDLLAQRGMKAVGYDPALPERAVNIADFPGEADPQEHCGDGVPGASGQHSPGFPEDCSVPECVRGLFEPARDCGRYDVLVLRHVLEHIPDPGAFLAPLLSSPGLREALVYIEVPDFAWIAERGAFYDLTYEHCGYFSEGSLVRLLNGLGLTGRGLTRGYAGQYLMGVFSPGEADGAGEPPPRGAASGRDFAAERERLVHEVFRGGPVCLWGASGKGVTFAADLPPEFLPRVAAVVDADPSRQGLHLPVTGLAVRSPESLRELPGPLRVAVMNPVYREEIADRIKGMGLTAELIGIA